MSKMKQPATPAGGRSPSLPPIPLLLSLDEEYRRKAAEGTLKLIAPKKFNPDGKAWLPIMSTTREGWRFTVLYSNTQKAHELGKTNDWVVIYFDDGTGERQCTVVTEYKGISKGKRVVRGREAECAQYYRAAEQS